MIPEFTPAGLLPPGIHTAAWCEVERRFGWNARRQALLIGLREGLRALHAADCRLVYLDGSFVTAKELPGDFDACYDVVGMSPGRLDRVFFRLENKRAAQKLRFGGEFFPSHFLADRTRPFVDFFQVDKESGNAKGVISIVPGSAE